jgi:hypothetical protein
MPRLVLGRAPFFGDDQPHGDVGAFVPPPLENLESEVASRCRLVRLIAILVASLVVVAAGVVFCSLRPAHARDLGQWDRADPIVQWYSQLKQPDNPTISCCGEADAYWADESEINCGADRKNCQVIATVTDDRDDDPLRRMHVPVGTKYVIPPEKITRKDGNPTGHVILFLGGAIWVQGAFNPAARAVLCYVMNGGV